MANKNIVEVEEIEVLDGTEKVFVNSNGTLKQIKTKNAKFGGGGGAKTILYAAYASEIATQAAAASKDILCKDIEYTEIATAQEIYDAWANGEIWIDYDEDNYLSLVIGFGWLDSSGEFTDSADVVYCSLVTASGKSFTIGTDPASK